MKKELAVLIGGVLVMGVSLLGASIKANASQISEMAVNAEGGNVDFKVTPGNASAFTYDTNKYSVETSVEGQKQVVLISVNKGAEIIYSDRCVVFVPSNIGDISISANKAGVYLTGVDADIDIDCDYGAASIAVPQNYSKTINYSLMNGSGKLTLSNVDDYTISGSIATSTISAPTTFEFKKVYGKKENISYVSGGSANIIVDIEKSTVKFED